MDAVFDKNCRHVGWYDNNTNTMFDDSMNWIGFICNGYLFSNNTTWLGGVFRGTIVDRYGRAIAWIDGVTPQGTSSLLAPAMPCKPFSPARPMKPLRPLRPLRPLTPVGGWSTMQWEDFLSQ